MTVNRIPIFRNGGKIIDDVIDPDNVFMDEENNIQSIYDPETGKTFKTDSDDADDDLEKDEDKDKGEKDEESEGGDPDKKKDKDKDKDSPGEDSSKGDKDDADKDDSPDPQYLNGADYILKVTGYEGDEVQIGETSKKIAELTHEEQMRVVIEEFRKAVSYYEDALGNPENQQQGFQNEDEKEIIEYLRNGGDKIALAKHILSNDPSERISAMSDEDIVKDQLRKEFPDWTDEDLDEEVEALKDRGRLEKRAGIYRERYKKEASGLGDLTESQKAAKEEADRKLQEKHDKEVNDIREAAKKIKTIAGVPVNENILNNTMSKLIPQKPDEESEFLRNLGPEKIIRLQFLDDNIEKILENTARRYYELGKSKSEKVIKKFSDEPYGFLGGSPKKEEPAKPNGELDMDKLLDIKEF